MKYDDTYLVGEATLWVDLRLRNKKGVRNVVSHLCEVMQGRWNFTQAAKRYAVGLPESNTELNLARVRFWFEDPADYELAQEFAVIARLSY